MAVITGRSLPIFGNRTRSSKDADVVMFIFREEAYKPDESELSGVAEIIVAKQRNGPTGKVHLTFLKTSTRFESAAGQEEVPLQ